MNENLVEIRRNVGRTAPSVRTTSSIGGAPKFKTREKSLKTVEDMVTRTFTESTALSNTADKIVIYLEPQHGTLAMHAS